PLLKLALDLGPLLIFFAANSLFGIFTATAIFMAVILVAIVIGIVLERRILPVAFVTSRALPFFCGSNPLAVQQHFFTNYTHHSVCDVCGGPFGRTCFQPAVYQIAARTDVASSRGRVADIDLALVAVLSAACGT